MRWPAPARLLGSQRSHGATTFWPGWRCSFRTRSATRIEATDSSRVVTAPSTTPALPVDAFWGHTHPRWPLRLNMGRPPRTRRRPAKCLHLSGSRQALRPVAHVAIYEISLRGRLCPRFAARRASRCFRLGLEALSRSGSAAAAAAAASSSSPKSGVHVSACRGYSSQTNLSIPRLPLGRFPVLSATGGGQPAPSSRLRRAPSHRCWSAGCSALQTGS
jgi:hypothetical protein